MGCIYKLHPTNRAVEPQELINIVHLLTVKLAYVTLTCLLNLHVSDVTVDEAVPVNNFRSRTINSRLSRKYAIRHTNASHDHGVTYKDLSGYFLML